jgi:hypothetical protein
VLAVAAELELSLLGVAELAAWPALSDWLGAGACWPTDAFELAVLGEVLAASLLAELAEELWAELVDWEAAPFEPCVPLLLISLGTEPFEGFELFGAALFEDISVLLAAAPAPAAAAPVFAAEGPELLLPAPQWSETMVTLLTWKAFPAPAEELVLLGEALEPAALVEPDAGELFPLAPVFVVLEAVLGWPVIWTWCPTWAAKLSVLPVSVYTVPVALSVSV